MTAVSERAAPLRPCVAVLALLFVTSATVTVVWCASMSAKGDMPMPGGWTMSMMWMRMPAQTWAGTATSFVGMWVTMMVAMMLPSLASMLWRYREAIGRTRPGLVTTLVALGYFSVWTLFGLAVFPMGAALAAVEMRQPALARAVPLAAGLVVLIAGTLQFTRWKADRLACCREAPWRGRTLSDARSTCRQGIRYGIDCSLCCANLTAVLLVFGVMDLYAMAAVTASITAERLAPAVEPVRRAIGFVAAGAGLFLIARAAGLQ